MPQRENVLEALYFIQKKITNPPRIALVLGSGLADLAHEIEHAEVIPYAEIPYWPHSTVPGHPGRLVFGQLEGVSVVVLQGRTHYYEGYSEQEVSFPVRLLGEWGVRDYFATNASGGINTRFAPGDLVAIFDHINFMGANPLIGSNEEDWGPRFPDMTYAYNPELLDVLSHVADQEGITLHRGIYIAFSGPSFETPAEIRMARTLGADIVGMSTVPEVIAANHMGMRVAAVSCVANYAAGIQESRLTHEEVLAEMQKSADKMGRLIRGFLREFDR